MLSRRWKDGGVVEGGGGDGSQGEMQGEDIKGVGRGVAGGDVDAEGGGGDAGGDGGGRGLKG